MASILTVMVILSPLATAFSFMQNAKLASRTIGAEVVAPSGVESNFGLVPKASHELIFSSLDRTLVSPLYFFDCSSLVDEVDVLAGWQNYLRNNDLHFNIPSITYRQPSSEHPAEG